VSVVGEQTDDDIVDACRATPSSNDAQESGSNAEEEIVTETQHIMKKREALQALEILQFFNFFFML